MLSVSALTGLPAASLSVRLMLSLGIASACTTFAASSKRNFRISLASVNLLLLGNKVVSMGVKVPSLRSGKSLSPISRSLFEVQSMAFISATEVDPLMKHGRQIQDMPVLALRKYSGRTLNMAVVFAKLFVCAALSP